MDFNQDLNPSGDFLADQRFAPFAGLLQHDELNREFSKHDRKARFYKRIRSVLGVASLVIGSAAMVGIILELLLPAMHQPLSDETIIAIECTALASLVVLAVDTFVIRSKHRYLDACYMRERLRQWHFQVFLDGKFVEGFAADAASGTAELSRRFKHFLEEHRLVHGRVEKYRHDVTARDDLLHTVTKYSSAAQARDVFSALKILRFEHQLQFTHGKLDPTGEHWAETAARLSLVGAIFVPVVQLVLITINQRNHFTWFENAHVSLSGLALSLVVLSVAARAYRSGMSIPEEHESYEEYLHHVDFLTERLSHTTPTDHVNTLAELEMAAEQELRRFLNMKAKATFVAG